MPLPTLEKTWQFTVNQRTAASGSWQTDYRNAVLMLKNALIGFPQSPWVVLGSSDSVTAGMDGIDRWTDASKIKWADDWYTGGNPHSWIVLRQAGLAPNFPTFQLCINCHSEWGDDGRLIEISVSPFGTYTGGSINTRPQGAREMWQRNGHGNYGYWFSNYTSSFAPVVHVMQSTDGQALRAILCHGGKSRTLIHIEVPADTPAAMTHPLIWIVMGWSGDSSYIVYDELMGNLRYTGQYTATQNLWPEGNPDYWGSTTLTAEGNVDGPVSRRYTGPNDITGEYPLCPLGVQISLSKVPIYMRGGRVRDMWFGSTGLADGTTYGSGALAQFGHFVFPWNSTLSPLLT